MKSILKPLLMIAAMAMGMTAAGTLPALALVELNVNKGNVEPFTRLQTVPLTAHRSRSLSPCLDSPARAG